jgi:hypothetical protein
MDAARVNCWGHRDATAILVAYRHGLRASELVALRWDDIDFATGAVRPICLLPAPTGSFAASERSSVAMRGLYFAVIGSNRLHSLMRVRWYRGHQGHTAIQSSARSP